LPLVCHLSVLTSAEGVGDEVERVAAIAERVQAEGDEVVALPHVRTVTAHLVGDDLVRLALPAAERDVEIVGVKRQPHFGLLGRRRALLRLLLNKV